MPRKLSSTCVSMSVLLATSAAAELMPVAASEPDDDIAEVTVRAARVANTRPAAGFASVITLLRFDPLAELQSRGLAEGQSDVTVRGGIFENTGFKIAAVTVVDPQTGHYAAGLPLDPELATAPIIMTGVENGIEGFNSAIATIAYAISPLDDGGSFALGAGSDKLNFQSARMARTTTSAAGNDIGLAISLARSAGDGSVANGDHRFARYNLLLQRLGRRSQSDLLVSYQDKTYAWPGAYTGFASLAEIDDVQTTMLLASHRSATAHGWWELGAYYRRLVDDYDFDRTTSESGTPGSFEHETRVTGIGLRGRQQTGRVSWRYAAQLASDELVRSTDLTNGRFDSRRSATLTIVPSTAFDFDNGRKLTVQAGATFDYSSRDSNAGLPLLAVSYGKETSAGQTEFALEYAASSQLPGYTALNSNPTGLFGGNPGLGRERARQIALSVSHTSGDWQGRVTAFSRRDDKLVDWTYATAAPFSRQANPVDIDVSGLEAFFTRQWPGFDLAGGLTMLDKDANYGAAVVDASFYALNFARYRATLALNYRIADSIELRFDNEYRSQKRNPLRVGDDSAYLAALSIHWNSPGIAGLGVSLIVDNLTDSAYQPFPGTPAAGRQVSLSARYDW